MIFVTLGSQKFQFNRLLKKLDCLVAEGKITEKIYAQIGFSDYKPLHYDYIEYMDRDAFTKTLEEADLILTHGGSGVIINGSKLGKKVIAIPRLARYGEHVDDHQIQLVGEFEELGMICACYDVSKLEECLETVRKTEYKNYVSTTQNVIDSIEAFIDSI